MVGPIWITHLKLIVAQSPVTWAIVCHGHGALLPLICVRYPHQVSYEPPTWNFKTYKTKDPKRGLQVWLVCTNDMELLLMG